MPPTHSPFANVPHAPAPRIAEQPEQLETTELPIQPGLPEQSNELLIPQAQAPRKNVTVKKSINP